MPATLETTIETVYGKYKSTKFWIIVAAISGGSMLALPGLVSDLNASDHSDHPLFLFLLLLIAAFGITLLPFAIWQQVTKRRFFTWLESQWSNLETGASHPDGYTISLDTQLVKYQVVFSALLATVSFESRPYVLQDRSAGAAQATFTFLSLIFGWWFFGPEGVVETLKAVTGNVRSSRTFTLRQLIHSSK